MKQNLKKFNSRKTIEQVVFFPWEQETKEVIFAGKCVCCSRNTYQIKEKNGHKVDPDPKGFNRAVS